jgi:integrase
MENRLTINTKKAYASDMAYIQQWAYITFGSFNCPIAEDTVLLFITDHLQGMEIAKEWKLTSPVLKNGYKAKSGLHSLATVRRRLSALTAHHKELGYEDPCSGKAVKHLIQTMSRAEKKTIQQKAITTDIFEKLIAICDDSVKGIRNKAILLLAWTTGGRRRSEIAAAQVEHLTSVGDNFLLHIPLNNSRSRNELAIPVEGRAAQSLRDWMQVADVRNGAIFRSVNKCGKVSNNRLAPIEVNRIVKNCCKAAGFDEKQFGAHSLRSGFLTQEARLQSILSETANVV